MEVWNNIISVGRNSISPYQPGISLFPFLRIIRAPGGIGTLRTMTGSSPVPSTTVTEENIHAQGFSNPQFEFIQPSGIASLLHFVRFDK